MKQFRKLCTIALLLLVVASFTVALALWIFLPREQVAAIITSELSTRLNQDITMGTFSIGFYPGVEFVTRNVRVVNPPTSREILSAQKVRFDLNLRELLSRKCVVEDITVGSPRLDLARNASGAWNVENLIGSVRSGEKKDQTSEPVSWFEFGRVKIKNGSISISDESLGQQLTVSNLAATFDVKDDTLFIDSASIVSPALEAELSGTVSQPFKPAPLFDISATLDIKKEGPLADSKSITVPPGKKIADIYLEASGTIKKVKLSTTFSLNPLATAELSTRGSLAGTLTVEDGLFTVDTLTTYLGKSTLALSGTLNNIWKKERSANLKGTTGLSLKEVVNLTNLDVLSSYQLRGIADASINLVASAEQVGLTTTIDLDNANFSVPQIMDKQIGTPGKLSLDLHYIFPDELVVDNFELSIGRNKISGNLAVQPKRDPWLNTSFYTTNFSLGHLNRLPALNLEEGTLDLSAKVWQSKEGLRFSTDAVIDDASLTVMPMNQPFEKLDGWIKADNNKATLHTNSFFFRESLYQLDADITDFNTPRITGHLRTDLLDINDIIDAFSQQGKMTKESSPASGISPPDFSLELYVSADAMHFGTVKTGPVSTTWKTSGRVQQFDPLQIQAFGGTLGGMFELAVLKDGISWRTDLSGQDMIIEEIFTQLFEESERVKGILNAQGNLSGRADDDPAEVWRSLNGELDYSVTNSQFNQSPLFKSMLLATRSPGMLIPGLQIVSLSNLLADVLKSRGRTLNVNQVYFNNIDGTVQISDGLARMEDSFWDGEAVDLLFTGDIDLVKGDYNMKARATPIGTIGSLMGKIPLLGNQIDRLRKASLSFSFNITGPFDDPNVQLTALERITPQKKE